MLDLAQSCTREIQKGNVAFTQIKTEMCVRLWTRSLPVARRQVLSLSFRLSSLGNPRLFSQMRQAIYKCDVDAEPIDRYRPGGYHPIELGQVLKNGRYKILHKIGWGGFSTTWAARDQW